MQKVVKFRSSFSIKDGDVVPSFGKYTVNTEFIKQYKGALYKLHTLSSCARTLMDYLIENSGDSGVINSNKYTRDNFNKEYVKIWTQYYIESEGLEKFEAKKLAQEKKFKDNTVAHAFTQLCKRGLLIQIQRGVYNINPEYFFKKSERERLDEIKLILEFSNKTRQKDIDEAKDYIQSKPLK